MAAAPDRFTLGAAVLVSAVAAAMSALAGPPEVMPIGDITPGMRGHAVTVFSGTKTDRFEIEVIDVVRDYTPGHDAILFRSSDPRLEHSGIVGGMSGSPIFIEGKLVGALAYGYRFGKDPIGGITPISSMLEIDRLPHRPEVQPRPRVRNREGMAAWADAMLGLETAPLPPRRRPDEIEPTDAGLAPLPLPMTVTGFGPAATRYLGDAVGLMPVRGGSGGLAKDAPAEKKFVPGDSVSVVLIHGDNAAAPNGTVTWVGGKHGERLLAFGHPMFGAGPSRLPIADARVHVIIPSYERSVKIASPLALRGTMVQDRPPAIALRTDIKTDLIPVRTTIQGADDDLPVRTYESAVADHAALTSSLVAALLFDGLEEAGNDAVEVTVEIEHTIAFETSQGPRSVQLREEVWFPQGLVRSAFGRNRALLILGALLDNDFEIGRIRSVEQRGRVHYGTPVETIERIRLVDGEVRAGDIAEIEVELRPPRGDSRWMRIPIRIPDEAGGERIAIEVAGGDYVLPQRPIAGSLDDLIDTLAQIFPSRSIVATVYREGEGVATRQGLLEVPDSVLESLSLRGSTTGAARFKRIARRVLPSNTLIEGEHTLQFDVKPRRKV